MGVVRAAYLSAVFVSIFFLIIVCVSVGICVTSHVCVSLSVTSGVDSYFLPLGLKDQTQIIWLDQQVL